LLREGLAGVVAPADVILSTPDDFKAFTPLQPAVTVFLYHVALHGEMRNAPRRSGLNGVPRRPSLPLELRFLVTPWARRALPTSRSGPSREASGRRMSRPATASCASA
jgi:hypothetical protein